MFGNVMAIERALGTGIIISSSVPISQRVQNRIPRCAESGCVAVHR